MKTLILDNPIIKYMEGERQPVSNLQAYKIVKTDTDIIGYDLNGKELFAFRGISDFSQFTLEEGQSFDTEDDPVAAVGQQLVQQRMATLQAQQQQQALGMELSKEKLARSQSDQLLQALGSQLAEIKLQLLGGQADA
jgi:hypothetical protein